MIGFNLAEVAERIKLNAGEKCFARRENREPELIPKIESFNYLKGIPNEWCQILKQQCSLCPTCKNSTRNQYHMKEMHNTEIHSYKQIWSDIKDYFDTELEKHKKKKTILNIKRGIFLKTWRPVLKEVKEDIEEKFQKIYSVRN